MTISSVAGKSADAFRTISEVAEALKLPQHVLRFWETRFTQIKPLKRAGGRRFYRPEDVELLGSIRQLLYGEGYTIKGVQRILREQGPRAVAALARHHQEGGAAAPPPFGEDGSEEDGASGVAEEAGADEAPARPSGRSGPASGRPDDPAQAATSPLPLPWMMEPDADRAQRGSSGPGGGDALAALRAVLSELDACRRLLDEARS